MYARLTWISLISCWMMEATAQQLPCFGVLSCPFSQSAEGKYAVGRPRLLSHFNPRGYNNQPSFFSAHEIYLAVQFPTDTTQTDIVALDLSKQQYVRVTRTSPEAEYSPTLMPDGQHFSCVRVAADRTQQLWAYPLDRSHGGSAIFPSLHRIGYHCWLTDDLLALFIVGEKGLPHELVIASRSSAEVTKIAHQPGRCLQRLPDGRLAYVHKATEQTWFLKTYDVVKKTYTTIATTPAGSEDFVWLPDGHVLMGSGSQLLILPPGSDTWVLVEDFSRYSIRKITRMAYDGVGQLILVVE